MSKEAPHVPGAARRGRPPGRSPYQEEQRRNTRSAILTAAAEIFATKAYVHATIDDIIAGSGISRATFYVHFQSKLALAIAIYDGITNDWIAHFDRLGEMVPLQVDPVKHWVLGLANLYVAHGYVTPLTEQLAIFEQHFRERLALDQDALIERLADAGVPGFTTAIGNDREALLQRTRMRLLLQRLNQVCGFVSNQGAIPPAEIDAYVDVMARDLCRELA